MEIEIPKPRAGQFTQHNRCPPGSPNPASGSSSSYGGVGFRVWGFRVWGSGFRGLGFRGLGFRVWGLGFGGVSQTGKPRQGCRMNPQTIQLPGGFRQPDKSPTEAESSNANGFSSLSALHSKPFKAPNPESYPLVWKLHLVPATQDRGLDNW